MMSTLSLVWHQTGYNSQRLKTVLMLASLSRLQLKTKGVRGQTAVWRSSEIERWETLVWTIQPRWKHPSEISQHDQWLWGGLGTDAADGESGASYWVFLRSDPAWETEERGQEDVLLRDLSHWAQLSGHYEESRGWGETYEEKVTAGWEEKGSVEVGRSLLTVASW